MGLLIQKGGCDGSSDPEWDLMGRLIQKGMFDGSSGFILDRCEGPLAIHEHHCQAWRIW